MNLDFKRLTIENFKSFVEAQTLDLSANNPGLHFLCGENKAEPSLGANGAGKSTVFEALSWCLYGRTVSGLRNPDIKPWANSKATLVGVETVTDDKTHVIIRSTSPNRITIDDTDATQDDVEKLIGLRPEVFWHTIMLGQGQPLFYDLPPADKLRVFSEVLQLDRWEVRSEHAGAKVRELEREQDQIDGELRGAESQMTELVRTLTEAKQSSESWESTRQDTLRNLDKIVVQTRAKMEQADTALGTADLKQDSAGTEAKQLAKDVQRLEDTFREAETAVRARQGERQHQEIIKSQAERDLHDLSTSKTCPTCGQPIKKSNVTEHQFAMQTKIATATSKLAKLPITPLVTEAETHKKALAIAVKTKREFEAKEDEARDAVDRLRRTAVEAKGNYTQAVERRKVAEAESNPHREIVSKMRKRVTEAEEASVKLTNEMKIVTREIELHRFWVRGFKDVRLHVIDEVLQELEIVTNELLSEVGMGEWIVTYDTERETKKGTTQRGLDVSVLGPGNKAPVKWESWSGGEGQRLRVVGALALSEVLLNHAGVVPSLELLDEPSRGLSSEGVHDLIEMLASRAKSLSKNIFYVDHMARETTKFVSVITVVKDKAGSHIA